MRRAAATASFTDRAVPLAGWVTPSRRAEDRDARRFQRLGETQWGLAAQLDDHTLGTLPAHDLQYVLERQRLEVQLVRDVEVRRHRFRVRVDHDGLEAQLTKRQAGPDKAIVELDALADAIGTAAQDHDPLG